MVLVDSSVWIRFLGGRMPYAAALDSLLDKDEAAGHELIEGELLLGDLGARKDFLRSYGVIHRVPAVSPAEVVAFVRAHKLHGRGIGWIDAHLLASALVARVSFWTVDERLSGLANVLGVGYFPKVM